MNNELLPIGSVVKLKNGTHRLLIIGKYPTEGQYKKVYHYSAVSYPEGFITEKQIFVFNHGDIKEIYSKGFVDEEYERWNKKLEESLKDIKEILKND